MKADYFAKLHLRMTARCKFALGRHGLLSININAYYLIFYVYYQSNNAGWSFNRLFFHTRKILIYTFY